MTIIDTAPLNGDIASHADIESACEQACQAIAPTWPLDQAIAVNPHWGRIGRPLRQVAARMAVLGNIQVFPTRSYLSAAWEQGRIDETALLHALATLQPAHTTAQQCVTALNQPPAITQLPLLIDVLDDDPARDARLSWRQAITHQVSQTCAAYFDRHQADWQPERGEGLYAFWRDTLSHDHGIGGLMGLPQLGQRLHALPQNRQAAEQWALQRLGLPLAVWADYLEAVLLTVNGWASWCAWLGWQARHSGEQDLHLRELLAIRLAWGAVLLECKTDASAQRAFGALQYAWSHAPERLAEAERVLCVDEVWQTALDVSYQRQLASTLLASAHSSVPRPLPASPEIQAAFCIDVRSERLRRALETLSPTLQTIGFAGFFGLPIAYTPLATSARRPQLPGLLAPTLEVADCLTAVSTDEELHRGGEQTAAQQARLCRFAWSAHWQAGSHWPSAAFSFVEAAGFGYLGKLAGWLRPSAAARRRDDLQGLPQRYRAHCRPLLLGLDLSAKVDLAARILHAMGLEQDLAPLVLLVGHGSQSANNAQAAALDCGACCGQTGEVNARVLARLLNEYDVRAGLARRNIHLPAETTFVAALHNTTTDEFEWYDTDLLAPAAQARLQCARLVFEQAGAQVRRERAAGLGLDAQAGAAQLLQQLRRRANDGAETRPEWGLGGNAAFIIAPRTRTRGAMLDGRAFLHDYSTDKDPDGSVLELLMTAPMLVSHWINWQYHASTCEPQRLGSGNKLLHNVVGGTLGVFEGNGGDLRIGLSRQSLHNGRQWVHEPVRLTVVIEAPQSAIAAVIQRHVLVRQLIEHDWLHLWQMGADGLYRYGADGWVATGFEGR